MRRKGIAWIALVLALCLTLALTAGCGGKQAPAGQQAGQQGEKKEQPKETAKDDKYPSRTIEVINQFGPGGGTDIFIRGIGVPAAQILKQSIIPVSVTGGGGVAATDRFLQAPADGYTLRAIGPEQVVNHLMGREDLKQMVPIIRCQMDQSIFVVKADSKFKTIQDVVEYAKANPGTVNLGGTD
ncbi:MAG: putative tricarboxylic transport rane protein, partial [Clostridia bacterium]|nr:putative tricarboxylic transport rane protein [Clostridia bacterium]